MRKREIEGALECYYWQGGQQEEVDFVVKEGTRVAHLIQVCLDVDDPKTKAREVRALLKASTELKCENLLILTDSAEGAEEVSWFGAQGMVHYVPLWKWLVGGAGQ